MCLYRFKENKFNAICFIFWTFLPEKVCSLYASFFFFFLFFCVFRWKSIKSRMLFSSKVEYCSPYILYVISKILSNFFNQTDSLAIASKKDKIYSRLSVVLRRNDMHLISKLHLSADVESASSKRFPNTREEITLRMLSDTKSCSPFHKSSSDRL